jgi:ketosteroid isomerase-like protein
MTPTEIVEKVMALGHERLAEALELLHPDAEWIPDSDRPPLRGHDEIAAFVAEELDRLGTEVPEVLPTSMTQHGDLVLVYAQLRIPHTTGRRFVEMQQVAWVYEVSGDRVAKVAMYSSWDQARTAAGIAPGTPPTRRFRNWQLAIGLGRRPAAGVT